MSRRPAAILALLGPFLAFVLVTTGFAVADGMQEGGGGFTSAYNARSSPGSG